MAEVAILQRPGHRTVMAHTTKFSVDNIGHGNVITTGPHLKPQFVVADLAAEADPMEPMGEDHRSHPFGLGPFIDDDIGILCLNRP